MIIILNVFVYVMIYVMFDYLKKFGVINVLGNYYLGVCFVNIW